MLLVGMISVRVCFLFTKQQAGHPFERMSGLSVNGWGRSYFFSLTSVERKRMLVRSLES